MKVAIVGSRSVNIENLEKYIPYQTTEIVSGGAKGVDTCAKKYAIDNGIKLVEFYPEYDKFGKSAPLKRNRKIVEYSDTVIAFWDGKSRGTANAISLAKKLEKELIIYEINSDNS